MKKEKDYNNEIIDFIYATCLKNQLINAPIEVLIDNYSNKDDYIQLLKNIEKLINIDEELFLLDGKIYKKAKEKIDKGKKYNDKNINNYINEFILKLNNIYGINKKEKEVKIEQYLSKEETVRKIKILENKDLLKAMAYDGIVLSYIVNDLDYDYLNPIFTVSSIYYILENIPELFTVEEFKNNTIIMLTSAIKNSTILNISNKINAKKMINRLK